MLSMINGKNDLPYNIDERANVKVFRRSFCIREFLQVVSSVDQTAKRKFQESDRFELTRQNVAVCEAKLQAMRVVELFFNFRQNTRLQRFISEFKVVLEQARILVFFLELSSILPGTHSHIRCLSSRDVHRRGA